MFLRIGRGGVPTLFRNCRASVVRASAIVVRPVARVRRVMRVR